jgi:hypothetical protein
MQSSSNEFGVKLAPVEDADSTSMGPIDFAKYLCDQGELITEQRGPVALVARDMQIAYDEEVARRAKLTDAQLRAEGTGATEHVTLPLKGRRLRLLLYGGEDAERPGSSTTSWPSSFAISMELKDSYSQPSPTKHRDSSEARQVMLLPRFEVVSRSVCLDCV